eukprot:s2850_g5.t1
MALQINANVKLCSDFGGYAAYGLPEKPWIPLVFQANSTSASSAPAMPHHAARDSPVLTVTSNDTRSSQNLSLQSYTSYGNPWLDNRWGATYFSHVLFE